MRLLRDYYRFYYSLVATLKYWNLIPLPLLKEISKAYREHEKSVKIVFQANRQ